MEREGTVCSVAVPIGIVTLSYRVDIVMTIKTEVPEGCFGRIKLFEGVLMLLKSIML